MSTVSVTNVEAYDDDRLLVTGTVDDAAVTAVGHVSWLTNYFADGDDPKDRRTATPDEARAYCEALLRENAPRDTRAKLPVKIRLDG